MKGSTSNISFDHCCELCKELMVMTDASNNPSKEVTPEMTKKLKEIGESIDIGCSVVDAYLASKSG